MKLVVVARGGLEVLFDGEKRREVEVDVNLMGGLCLVVDDLCFCMSFFFFFFFCIPFFLSFLFSSFLCGCCFLQQS